MSSARRTIRCWALITVVLSLVVLTGCGSSDGPSLPKNVVARVGHIRITKAEYDHAMSVVVNADAKVGQTAGSITAIELGKLARRLKQSRLVLPVPPSYKSCIARWRQVGPEKGQPKPSTSDLKTLCEREYQALQQQALEPLIVTDWNLAEADEQGISVSEAQVHEQLEKELHGGSHSVSLQTVLSESGKTMSDLLQAAKVTLLRETLNEKAIPNHAKLAKKVLNEKLRELTSVFESKWTARTICARGYVISYCKEYKPPMPGKEAPEASSEANQLSQPAVGAPPPPSSGPPNLSHRRAQQ